MNEPIESDKFLNRPETDAKALVDYFNLEFGLYQFDESEGPLKNTFKEEDFKFIGFFISQSGQERMYFSVEGKDNLFAISVPLTNGQAMLSMTDETYADLKEFTFDE
ncbi:hypothetical protein [Motilimonas pumila]|uniref:Uncharacterized protein n=1 Tax=Motilimonas pumila TaxID=2303987 RepID=A0A418YG38_9GAMM|nr:hypothetical protein [Motilimonas pumila]RJG48382.1 hypothetical protein D1Z90_07770 [Motilimonas pumila]